MTNRVPRTIATVSVPCCMVCGSRGFVRYQNASDVWHRTPGLWSVRSCGTCQTFWLDPRPMQDADPAVYPEGYTTRSPPQNLLVAGLVFPAAFRLQLKREVLHRCYGYPVRAEQQYIRNIGALAPYIPGLTKRSGYTVRFLRGAGRVLDVGCGNGSFLQLMAQFGWDVNGIEPDPLAAAFAQSAGIPVHVGAVESASLAPESYDAITLNHVIEHMADPLAAFAQLVAALKPGGVLVSISPNPVGLLRRAFGVWWRALDPPRHVVLFGPKTLAEIATRFGLVPNVWVTNRNTAAWAAESLSGQRGGEWQFQRPIPKAIAGVARTLNLFTRQCGEEVVLVARKP